MHFIMQTRKDLSFQCGLDCGVSGFAALGLCRSATGRANVFVQVQHLMAQPGSGLGRGGGTLNAMCFIGISSNDCAAECSFYDCVVAKTAFDTF